MSKNKVDQKENCSDNQGDALITDNATALVWYAG